MQKSVRNWATLVPPVKTVVAAIVATVDVEAATVAAESVSAVSVNDADIERTELASGVRVITERMPEARSVSVGMWFAVGSRDEPAPIAGASHFLEHLLFKGTEERSARSIATAVDAVGGEMNAYTSREHTAYYLRLPVSELQAGVELLADVVSEPAFRLAELDAEREVIIEELLMSEDTPDDLVLTALYESLYPDHPLGRETLGDHDTVTAMTRDDVASFHAQWYRPSNLVVAAAGALEHQQVVDALGPLFVGTPPRLTCNRLCRLIARSNRCTLQSDGEGCLSLTKIATQCGSLIMFLVEACRAACFKRFVNLVAWPTPSSHRRLRILMLVHSSFMPVRRWLASRNSSRSPMTSLQPSLPMALPKKSMRLRLGISKVRCCWDLKTAALVWPALARAS
jgi:hypothetical protein